MTSKEKTLTEKETKEKKEKEKENKEKKEREKENKEKKEREKELKDKKLKEKESKRKTESHTKEKKAFLPFLSTPRKGGVSSPSYCPSRYNSFFSQSDTSFSSQTGSLSDHELSFSETLEDSYSTESRPSKFKSLIFSEEDKNVLRGGSAILLVQYLIYSLNSGSVSELESFFLAYPQFFSFEKLVSGVRKVFKAILLREVKNINHKLNIFIDAWFCTSIARDIRREDPKRIFLKKLLSSFEKYADKQKVKSWKLLLIRKWFYTHIETLENSKDKEHENIASKKKSLKTGETNVPSLQKHKTENQSDLNSLVEKKEKDKESNPYFRSALPRLNSFKNPKRLPNFVGLKKANLKNSNFSDFNALQIAKGLTEIEWELFVSIPETEFFGAKWVQHNPNREKEAPHLVEFVNRFNDVTYWVATEVIMSKDKFARTKNIMKFIDVASYCWKFHSFNTLFEILGGLTLFIVKSLDAAWQDVPKKYQTTFQTLLEIMNPKGSFALYRKSLKKAHRAIPWVGVDLKDLIFIEEGNDNCIGVRDFINYEKLLMVGSVLSRFANYQDGPPFSFGMDEHKHYFEKLIFADEEVLERQAGIVKLEDRKQSSKDSKKEGEKPPTGLKEVSRNSESTKRNSNPINITTPETSEISETETDSEFDDMISFDESQPRHDSLSSTSSTISKEEKKEDEKK